MGFIKNIFVKKLEKKLPMKLLYTNKELIGCPTGGYNFVIFTKKSKIAYI